MSSIIIALACIAAAAGLYILMTRLDGFIARQAFAVRQEEKRERGLREAETRVIYLDETARR